ncbi:MAG: toll/interleukin-1 receptor domain-containing protein [Hyphomonadaceae bacterium]
MADIFVSYAHANKNRVSALAQGLSGSGFSLWWDDHLRAGSDFTLEIERELDTAKCVVVAWSGAARNSLWVRAEATEALDAGKLVQIKLDGVKPPCRSPSFRCWISRAGGKSVTRPGPNLRLVRAHTPADA